MAKAATAVMVALAATQVLHRVQELSAPMATAAKVAIVATAVMVAMARRALVRHHQVVLVETVVCRAFPG